MHASLPSAPALRRYFFCFSIVATLLLQSCAPIDQTAPTFDDPPLDRLGVIELAREYDFDDVMTRLTHAIPALPYTTYHNVAGRPLYLPDMPLLLRRGTIEKLAFAEQELLKEGYRLLLWDGYRPPEAARALWEFAGQKNFVADPRIGWSTHCCGIAVDLTLTDLAGRPVAMPSNFDHFGPEASARYQGSSGEVRQNLAALQNAMQRAGFSIYGKEWWHFEDRDIFPLRSDHVLWASQIRLGLPSVASPENLR